MPEKLDGDPPIAWRQPLTSHGLGGLAADHRMVIVSGRDPLDQNDFYQALAADSGKRLWHLRLPAAGQLDYGNAPRATPLIAGEQVYLLGAFGNLLCVSARTGQIQWQRNLALDYPGELPTWGFCGTPLLIEDTLVLQTNCPTANLIGLNPQDGSELWRNAGQGLSYSSMIAVPNANATTTIVGYDAVSLGGWDPASGRRLWTFRPEHQGDFNVPTPIFHKDQLWLSTENNGTRRYELQDSTKAPQLVATDDQLLRPDTHSPVLSENRLLGVWNGLHCLDAETLKSIWSSELDCYQGYASIIANSDRALIWTQFGDLILVSISSGEYQELGRWQLTDGRVETHAHPAIAGQRLFLRVGKEIVCLQW